MRPIKFRAWCNQKMFEPFDLMDLKEPIDYWHDGTILMQFTGLHDKNGKEIFEGDIIKDLGAGYEEIITPVRFYQGAFCDSYWNQCINNYKYCEVLGNIYENPELLK